MSIISEYWQRFQVSLFPHLETVLEEPLTQLKQLYRGYIRFLMAFVMIGTTNLLQPARGIQMDFSLRNPLIGAQPLFPSSTASTALSSLQSLVKPMSDTKQNNGSYYWSFQPNLTAEGPRASVHAISGQYFEYVISITDSDTLSYRQKESTVSNVFITKVDTSVAFHPIQWKSMDKVSRKNRRSIVRTGTNGDTTYFLVRGFAKLIGKGDTEIIEDVWQATNKNKSSDSNDLPMKIVVSVIILREAEGGSSPLKNKGRKP